MSQAGRNDTKRMLCNLVNRLSGEFAEAHWKLEQLKASGADRETLDRQRWAVEAIGIRLQRAEVAQNIELAKPDMVLPQ